MTAFEPSDWLDRFEAHGGGWIVRAGIPTLLCPAGAVACDWCLADLEPLGLDDERVAHV